MDSSTEGPPISRSQKLGEKVSQSRRTFLKRAGVVLGGAVLGAHKLGFLFPNNEQNSLNQPETSTTLPSSNETPTQTPEPTSQPQELKAQSTAAPVPEITIVPSQSSTTANEDKSYPQPVEPVNPSSENKSQLSEYTDLAIQMVQKAPYSEERKSLEGMYCKKLLTDPEITFEKIRLGLMVMQVINNRGLMINKLFELRQSSKDQRLKRLTDEEIKWAEDHNMHPEALGLAQMAIDQAKPILEKILQNPERKKWFRPDLYYKCYVEQDPTQNLPKEVFDNLTVDDIVPNRGELAQLLLTETRNPDPLPTFEEGDDKFYLASYPFVRIGDDIAENHINEVQFPTGKEALAKLCATAFNLTGIPFSSKTLVGSVPRETGDASGGAIGPQIMPDNILEVIRMIEENTGVILNPLDPIDQLVIGVVFLAWGREGEKVDEFRWGHLERSVVTQKYQLIPQEVETLIRVQDKSYHKWNPHEGQKLEIIQAGESFVKNFVN